MNPPAHPPPAVAASHRELELKLFVPASSIDRLWSHPLVVESAIGPLVVARLANRYFDTPTRELAQRRMALRLRRIGRRWVQTLKTGGARDGAISERGEWEMPVAGAALDLAKLGDTPLAAIASPRTLARRLAPVFSTDFRRESRLLRLADGSEVELAFDRGTIATGRGRTRRSAPICEVEVELKRAGREDGEAALLRFAARLARDVALIPFAAGKAARGYRLSDGDAGGAVKVDWPTPTADDRVRPYLARLIGACNDALLDNVHALFALPDLDRDDAVEPVHQARVAIRRLRSALFTFRAVAKGRRFAALDDALRGIGHAFGDARDWDVLVTSTMKRLDDIVARSPDDVAALAALGPLFAERRAAAHEALSRALREGPLGATTIAAQRLVVRVANDDPGPLLGDVAPRWLAKQYDRVVDRARRIAVLDLAARHALRIEVKRLRYALDVLGPLFDASTVVAFGDALADLQGRLGRLNDEAVAQELIRTLEPSAARDAVLARVAQWFDRHLGKQLPKVAAQSVALELAPRPWTSARARAFG